MFVLGLAKHEDKLVIILDIERLVVSSMLGDTKAA
jgi:chemotaxis signal transduction protein